MAELNFHKNAEAGSLNINETGSSGCNIYSNGDSEGTAINEVQLVVLTE